MFVAPAQPLHTYPPQRSAFYPSAGLGLLKRNCDEIREGGVRAVESDQVSDGVQRF